MRRASREAAELIALMFAPMMPHLAEECWRVRGHGTAVVDTPWPVPEPALIADDQVTMAVQVNGKRRDEVRLAKGLEKAEVESIVLKLDSVRRSLDGRLPKKVIIVPDRIVNIVV